MPSPAIPMRGARTYIADQALPLLAKRERAQYALI
jgi:hypothetical protein